MKIEALNKNNESNFIATSSDLELDVRQIENNPTLQFTCPFTPISIALSIFLKC